MKYSAFLLLLISCALLRGCRAAWSTDPRVHVFIPSTPQQEVTTDRIGVMSYNIHSGFTQSGSQDVLAHAANMKHPHIHYVMMQEVNLNVNGRCSCNQPQMIAEATGKSVVFLATIPGFQGGSYGVAVSSAFPLLEVKHRFFDNPFGVEQRGAIAIRTSPPQLNGTMMWAVSTHLEWYNDNIKIFQINQLHDFVRNTLLAAYPTAFVSIAGDFNTVPPANPYNTMASYYLDTWTVFNGSPYGLATYPAEAPTSRFDYIFYRNSASVLPTVYYARSVPVVLSDHRPYVAIFSFLNMTPNCNK